MATRKTWVWIIVGIAGVSLVALIAVAGAGVYFVSRHIRTERMTSADAIRAFDSVKSSFHDQRPLYELDSAEHPRVVRPLMDLPTSNTKPESLWVLAWDPDDERLVKVSLPFWMLSVGRKKMEIAGAGREFDLERLNLDTNELERIGPALLFDLRERDGARVLLWTQ